MSRRASSTRARDSRHDEERGGVLPVIQTKAQTEAFYNRIGRVYDFLADRTEAPVRREGLALLRATPGEHVLEIGFGTGRCLAQLARAVGPGGSVSGVELADEMIRLTQPRLDAAGLAARAKLVRGDAEHLPWRTGVFDAVFMSFVLELFDVPVIARVLAECRRVLQPGGRIVIVGLSKAAPASLVLRVFEWTHRHFPKLLDCRPIFVRRSLRAAGFQIQCTVIRKRWVPVEIVLAFH